MKNETEVWLVENRFTYEGVECGWSPLIVMPCRTREQAEEKKQKFIEQDTMGEFRVKRYIPDED